jgi:hypothetical protein
VERHAEKFVTQENGSPFVSSNRELNTYGNGHKDGDNCTVLRFLLPVLPAFCFERRSVAEKLMVTFLLKKSKHFMQL